MGKVWDICLGDGPNAHVACTVTSTKARDAVKKVFKDHAADLYQAGKLQVREADRPGVEDEPAPEPAAEPEPAPTPAG